MKNIFRSILLFAAATFTLASCDNLLDTESPSTQEASVVYSNYTYAEQAIFSIHQTFGNQNSYRGRFLPWYGFNTDIEWFVDGKSTNVKTEIVNYSITVNDGQLNTGEKNCWADMYSGIERANLAIEGLLEYGDIENKPEMAYLYAEALTLRAMIYYDLIKAWGDVPARFSSLTSGTMYVAKSSRDVVFERILSDLDTAIPMLYYPGKNAATMTTDRVNKVFAEGLYARIALLASGYALRPADGKEGTGDPGSVRLSSDENLSKSVLYPKALAYLKDAIQSGTASLYEDYETLWRNFNNMDLTAGKEVLFSIPFGPDPKKLTGDPRGRWNYHFAIDAAYSPIGGKGGDAGPTPNFWFKFDPQDVRRDITCANFNFDEKAAPTANKTIATWYFGKYRFDWMETLPYNGSDNDGIKPIVMRYSDIYLMAAEIENELNGPTQARQYLLPVRERAFKGNEDKAEEYVNSLTDKTAFFNAIVDERAFEFCGEFLRKADLIRWNLLGSKLRETKADLEDLGNMTGNYAGFTGNLWWRVNENGDGIEFKGLSKDETSSPGADWTELKKYVSPEAFSKDGKLDSYFANDPDTRQFWPIFQYTLDNSQGSLVNDYGY